MEIKTLTVFTPTYNRAYCLHKCYESLCRQTSKDFFWLIIDDGSDDNTKELIESWINEDRITIQYFYQSNQGMHGAHNAAYRLIKTELNVCIDSDDFMPDDAVEKIVTFWQKNGSKKYAGIIGLDYSEEGKIIGTKFPQELFETTLGSYYDQGGKGDKKLVYRTELIAEYPEYPVFEGEKYVGLDYKYLLIDQDYKLLTLNENLCFVDYQVAGSSMNMFRQYLNNPKGFAFYRKARMKMVSARRRKFIENIHYVSSSIISKNKHFLRESPYKLLTILAIPPGIALTVYIKYMVARNKQMKMAK